MLTAAELESYRRDGYVLVRGLLDAESTALLQTAARQDPKMREFRLERNDGEGGTTRLALWRDAEDNTLGMLARLDRIVEAAAQCVGEPVYHFHSKLIQKEAHEGGAWVWHQDYGYWYLDGFLYPRMVSCFIAIDPATRENGCLQVLTGSHELGRVEHGVVGDEKGADMQRVEAARKKHETIYCEMEPGDGLFFHCNVLHRSDQNRSSQPRWALVCCYNGVSNGPEGAELAPVETVSADAFKASGVRFHGVDASFLKD